MTKKKTDTAEKKAGYHIRPEFIGMTIYAAPPSYDREDGGIFRLNSDLSDKDMEYLYTVLQQPEIEKL